MEVASKLIATSILTDDDGQPINPLDAHFRSLRLSSMTPISRKTKEFKGLERYTQDTHGATHSHYKVQIQNAVTKAETSLNRQIVEAEDKRRQLQNEIDESVFLPISFLLHTC